MLISFQAGANGELEERTYKRVAIVEDFFDIIYNVHVEMDGRGGKHAGQKRTYRAVSNILEQILLRTEDKSINPHRFCGVCVHPREI